MSKTAATALAFVALFVAAGDGVARASDIPCGPRGKLAIEIDGRLDEWAPVAALDIGHGSRDFSFTTRCRYDEGAVYLAVNVRDDALVRYPLSAKRSSAEDYLELVFADGAVTDRLYVFPPDPERKIPPRSFFSSGRLTAGLEIFAARLTEGWTVEARLPLDKIPGWLPGSSSVKLAIAAFDCDSRGSPVLTNALSTSALDEPAHLGAVEFAGERTALSGFLDDHHLEAEDVRFDGTGRVLGKGAVGRVVMAGRFLAVIGARTAVAELPIDGAKDVVETRVLDLAGDGRDAILVRYFQTAEDVDASREVEAVYRLFPDAEGAGDGGGALRRTFAVEVARSEESRQLQCRVTLARRGLATDLVLEPLPAHGFNEHNYHPTGGDDVLPIPTPFGTPFTGGSIAMSGTTTGTTGANPVGNTVAGGPSNGPAAPVEGKREVRFQFPRDEHAR